MAQAARSIHTLALLMLAACVSATNFIQAVPNGKGGRVGTRSDVTRGYRERLCGSTDHAFSYNPSSSAGPSQWWRISPCCGGRLQSPIPLSRHTSRCMTSPTPRYALANVTMTGKLHNSGHHVMLTFPKDTERPRLCNVGRKDDVTEYVLDHVHLHFGGPYSRGSEHIIDGEEFQGELHMVHYRAEYGSVSKAMTQRDGLAVCAIPLSTARGDHNTHLHRLLTAVSSLKSIDQSVPFTLNPTSLLPRRRDMFYYRGSLTTPPCSETVQFIVMDQPLFLTTQQLHMLWRLPSSEQHVPISRYTNVRPLAAVNARPVLTNFVCWCCVYH